MPNSELRLHWEQPVAADSRPCAARFGVFTLQVRPASGEGADTAYEWRMVTAGFATRSGTAPTRIEAQRAAESALADRYGIESL